MNWGNGLGVEEGEERVKNKNKINKIKMVRVKKWIKSYFISHFVHLHTVMGGIYMIL